MNIVIQCAAKKYPEAGSFLSKDEKPVLFVANPESAPPDEGQIYARPDEPSGTGKTWRELLWEYNTQENANPLNLYPAYKLYMNRTYERLVDKIGVD